MLGLDLIRHRIERYKMTQGQLSKEDGSLNLYRSLEKVSQVLLPQRNRLRIPY